MGRNKLLLATLVAAITATACSTDTSNRHNAQDQVSDGTSAPPDETGTDLSVDVPDVVAIADTAADFVDAATPDLAPLPDGTAELPAPDAQPQDLPGPTDLVDVEPADLAEPDLAVAQDLVDDEAAPPDVGPDNAWPAMEAIVDDFLAGEEKVVSAVQVKADLEANANHWFVIDMRGGSLYAGGHIPGAVNIPLGGLGAAADAGELPTDKPLLLVCMAGQQSGWASGSLNLMGYDAWSMAFGMPAWSTAGGNMWASGCSNPAAGQQEATANAAGPPHEFPTVESAETAADLVADGAAEVLSGSFKLLTWYSIAGALDAYYIISLSSEEQYAAGHLPGAIHFPPGSLDDAVALQYLPLAQPILVTDCAGNVASGIAAALNVLGYDAYFLKFGESGLWCDSLETCGWSAAQANEFPTE